MLVNFFGDRQCHAVAAAIFGDKDKVVLLQQSEGERFNVLANGSIDVYMRAAPTMERQVYQVSR